ncbi:UPF0361 protein DC12 homolog, related [Neospora caninum Liverpool]|uniref:UPF0361 protein DC12 homolog, related n=1 Tax=Neospora caninum (strain Liverpool) TaxID=572307 RepID=F0VR86_NEOCL|nr:UPF0361 protein DC12 homolog, related [Neospora caninum Liverpool]CBZ56234.1 UPF0361 protein DC12 homolog, related [Neospora caninum Liverpool]CEL70996.1 TPA: UPF0361 protein DC12 homolog, related [Neospora caninum Liverpool]|eukprot:XP_003886259.1 UPF0361 protein DC12 homolog, related [Neospora caninum Liverpool]
MCGRMSCTLHPRRLRRIAGLVSSPLSASSESKKAEGTDSVEPAKSEESRCPVTVKHEAAAAPAPSVPSSAATSHLAKTATKEETDTQEDKKIPPFSALSPSSSPSSSFSCAFPGETDAFDSHFPRPRFNVSPTCSVPIIEEATGQRRLRAARWYLRVPGQAPGANGEKALSYHTFNARAEGLTQSRLYRRLLDKRRCVVVADGFYEWKKPQSPGETKKQPFFIRYKSSVPDATIPKRRAELGGIRNVQAGAPSEETPRAVCGKRERDGEETKTEQVEHKRPREQLQESPSETAACAPGKSAGWPSALKECEAPLLFAGLFDDDPLHAAGSSPETRDCSATILTMESSSTPMAEIHTRMPVLLSPEDASTWLNTEENAFSEIFPQLLSRSKQLYRTALQFYPVTPRVGNSRYESSDCVLPLSQGKDGGSRAPLPKSRGMRTLDFFLKPATEKKK